MKIKNYSIKLSKQGKKVFGSMAAALVVLPLTLGLVHENVKYSDCEAVESWELGNTYQCGGEVVHSGLNTVLADTMNYEQEQQAEDMQAHEWAVTHTYEDNCLDLKNVKTNEYKFYCEADFK